MVLFKYFKLTSLSPQMLTTEERKTVNEFVKKAEEKVHCTHVMHQNILPRKELQSESIVLKTVLPELVATFLLLKEIFQKALQENSEMSTSPKEMMKDDAASALSSSIQVLPTKRQGRPLLLGQKLDKIVREVIRDTWKAGGVINTTIVVAIAKDIITAKNPLLLHENGGH